MPLRSVNYMLSVCVQNILKFSCRCRHRSHYDILKVKKNSSTKEIKASFIELSKKFHPDVNSGKRSHTDFLQISEAYKVLSRPILRQRYDAELAVRLRETTWPRKDMDPETWSDSTIWHSKHRRTQTHKQKPYYGIRGIKKLPHGWIVAVCLTTAGIALAVEAFLISKASRYSRRKIMMQTKANEEALASVRAEAVKFGNEIQLEKIMERVRMSKSSTPIMALHQHAVASKNVEEFSANADVQSPKILKRSFSDEKPLAHVNVLQKESDLNLPRT